MSFLARMVDAKSGRATSAILAASVVACLILQVVSIFTREINWDEFFYLSHIYSFYSGSLTRALQTAHVILFFWLPWTGGNEMSQVEIGRIVMLVFEVMTCSCIYLIARRFFDARSAVFAVLTYLTCNYVLDHGASFRADPAAASLAMLSLSLILLSGLRVIHLFLVAAAIAVAALITVKSVFYAPALIAAGIWRLAERPAAYRNFVRLVACALLAGSFFLAAYFALIAIMPSADHSGSRAMMASASEHTIGLITPAGLVRLLRSFLASPVSWLVIFGGMIIAIGQLKSPERRIRSMLFLALASPVLSLIVYRNSFPYFYPFILPPATLLAAYSAEALGRHNGRVMIASLLMLFTAILYWTAGLSWQQDVQKETVDQVHRAFPEPVAYIDRNSMISSFPKRGLFMSMWGLRSYVAKGQPVFADILKKERVPLLVVNSPSIEAALGIQPSSPINARLLAQDEAVLRNNYVPYWGAIWIAGKVVSLNPGCTGVIIAIPGRYVVRTSDAVYVNGTLIVAKSEISLSRGSHEFCTGHAHQVTLAWAVKSPKPQHAPKAGPIYRGFR